MRLTVPFFDLHLSEQLRGVIWVVVSRAALLEGHFMSAPKLVEYAAVFGGFVGVKAGFDGAASERSRAEPRRHSKPCPCTAS